MKFLSIILSFYIASLSIDFCCQEDACGDDNEIKIAGQHDESISENCSPFLSCGSSTGFVAEDLNTYGTDWIVEPACLPSHIPFTPEYTPNIWQPPKLA